jgi:hypothetical protein
LCSNLFITKSKKCLPTHDLRIIYSHTVPRKSNLVKLCQHMTPTSAYSGRKIFCQRKGALSILTFWCFSAACSSCKFASKVCKPAERTERVDGAAGARWRTHNNVVFDIVWLFPPLMHACANFARTKSTFWLTFLSLSLHLL